MFAEETMWKLHVFSLSLKKGGCGKDRRVGLSVSWVDSEEGKQFASASCFDGEPVAVTVC